MAAAVQIPKLGNTVEECLIIGWRKNKGDRVDKGDILAEIETDKATFELEATTDGVLLEIFYQQDDLVPVFTTVAVIGQSGENIDEFYAKRADEEPALAITSYETTEQPSQKSDEHIEPSSEPLQKPALRSHGKWSPRAKTFARQHNFFPTDLSGSGSGGRVLAMDVREVFFARPRLTALARQLVQEENRTVLAPDQPIIYAEHLSAPAKSLSRIRAKSAKRLIESLHNTAQYTLTSSADATQLLQLRSILKQHASTKINQITINSLVLCATIKALQDYPQLNAEFIDKRIIQHPDINLCFACDTPNGLVVPVIHQSQNLTPSELASRVKSLAQQAEEGKLTPENLAGGTFTVSNLGTYGIESFTPILYAPQVALLGVNAIQLKPVRRNGVVQFVDYIGLSLTLDHQVIDGLPGAQFLQRLCEIISFIDEFVDLPLNKME
ncbi:2-oxo acid dehydrogenase subunit E2 [candidate division KSB1 bacterium]|nr:2-oxo acid dehydrogenase subunit E2 [candidate division KSB1 bacterium]